MRYTAGNAFIIVAVVMMVYVVFSVNMSEGFVDAGRCGVGLPSCSGEHVRCINGYCRSDAQPAYPTMSDLQMTPSVTY